MNIDAETILITCMIGGMAWIARDLLNTSKVLSAMQIKIEHLEEKVYGNETKAM